MGRRSASILQEEVGKPVSNKKLSCARIHRKDFVALYLLYRAFQIGVWVNTFTQKLNFLALVWLVGAQGKPIGSEGWKSVPTLAHAWKFILRDEKELMPYIPCIRIL